MQQEHKGLWLGSLGILIFSGTLPATRAAVADLSPITVGLGRALVAAVIAVIILVVTRQRIPTVIELKKLLIVAPCIIIGFPWLAAWAMQYVPAAHGSVVLGMMPLVTTAFAVLLRQEQPSKGFWILSLLSSTIVIVFSLWQGGGRFQWADAALFLAMLMAGLGYAVGTSLARTLGGWQSICWALVIVTPFLIWPVWSDLTTQQLSQVNQTAWLGFAYTALISQLLGFVVWYQGLIWGGIVRVSQLQLIQPFLTLLISNMLLHETIHPFTLLCAVLVVGMIMWNRRMKVKTYAVETVNP